jgi:hypothetical protein
VPRAAAPSGRLLEPQTDLSGVRADDAEPAPSCEAAPPHTRTTATVCSQVADSVWSAKVDTSINSERLIRIFERLRKERGLPQILMTENGPEFLGESCQKAAAWFHHGVRADALFGFVKVNSPHMHVAGRVFRKIFDWVIDTNLKTLLILEAPEWRSRSAGRATSFFIRTGTANLLVTLRKQCRDAIKQA